MEKSVFRVLLFSLVFPLLLQLVRVWLRAPLSRQLKTKAKERERQEEEEKVDKPLFWRSQVFSVWLVPLVFPLVLQLVLV